MHYFTSCTLHNFMDMHVVPWYIMILYYYLRSRTTDGRLNLFSGARFTWTTDGSFSSRITIVYDEIGQWWTRLLRVAFECIGASLNTRNEHVPTRFHWFIEWTKCDGEKKQTIRYLKRYRSINILPVCGYLTEYSRVHG